MNRPKDKESIFKDRKAKEKMGNILINKESKLKQQFV